MPNKNFPLGISHRERLISAMDEAIVLVNQTVEYFDLQHPEATELIEKLYAIRDELQQKNNTDLAALKQGVGI